VPPSTLPPTATGWWWSGWRRTRLRWSVVIRSERGLRDALGTSHPPPTLLVQRALRTSDGLLKDRRAELDRLRRSHSDPRALRAAAEAAHKRLRSAQVLHVRRLGALAPLQQAAAQALTRRVGADYAIAKVRGRQLTSSGRRRGWWGGSVRGTCARLRRCRAQAEADVTQAQHMLLNAQADLRTWNERLAQAEAGVAAAADMVSGRARRGGGEEGWCIHPPPGVWGAGEGGAARVAGGERHAGR
jgi:hypothetical protein